MHKSKGSASSLSRSRFPSSTRPIPSKKKNTFGMCTVMAKLRNLTAISSQKSETRKLQKWCLYPTHISKLLHGSGTHWQARIPARSLGNADNRQFEIHYRRKADSNPKGKRDDRYNTCTKRISARRLGDPPTKTENLWIQISPPLRDWRFPQLCIQEAGRLLQNKRLYRRSKTQYCHSAFT